MKFHRLKFSQEASDALGRLKGWTGLTPNILARLGFCVSLNDPTVPNPDDYGSDSNREIDRKVLLGDWDDLFVALLKERCHEDGIKEDEYYDQFRAHMNRGAMFLYKRVRSINDIARLLPKEYLENNG